MAIYEHTATAALAVPLAAWVVDSSSPSNPKTNWLRVLYLVDRNSAVVGTGLACQPSTFAVDGRTFHLVGTLASLNMAPAP